MRRTANPSDPRPGPGAGLGTSSTTHLRQRARFVKPQRSHSSTPDRSPSSVLHFPVGCYFRFRSGSAPRSLIALPASSIAFRTPVTVSSKYIGPASTVHWSKVKSLLNPSFWSRVSVS